MDCTVHNIREPAKEDITNKCENLNHEKFHNTYYVSNTGTLSNEGLHMWDTEHTGGKGGGGTKRILCRKSPQEQNSLDN